jgi:ketosteroid isomerase-like protein
VSDPALDAVARWSDGFARKDRATAITAFTERDDLLVVNASTVLDGRTAVLEYIDRYMAGDTIYDWRWASIRSARAGDIAWVFAEGAEIKSTPDGQRTFPYRATIVLRREQSGWRIVQFHGSSPRGTTLRA